MNEIENTIGIYHSRDLDGYTSGAIIKLKYPNAKLIGYDYGQPIPFDDIPENHPIIMADVSVPIKDMEKLLVHSSLLFTWLDHHKSAITEFVQYNKINTYNDGDRIKGVFGGINVELQNGISACEITWQHLFPDTEMPEAVLLLGEYDTWRNKDKDRWENKILPFQFGMRMLCNSPETFPKFLFEAAEVSATFVNPIIQNGKTILRYQAQVNEQACKAAFEYEFEGLRCICLNGGGFNSDVFKSVYDENKHDAMMPFKYDGKINQWVFSLYGTKDIDLSVIAKKYGGGGHAKACGFQISDINNIFKFLK